MDLNFRYCLIAFLALISNAAAHSAHTNHPENTTASGQSAVTSILSSYPNSTELIVMAELGIGVLLLIVAFWHFRKTS